MHPTSADDEKVLICHCPPTARRDNSEKGDFPKFCLPGSEMEQSSADFAIRSPGAQTAPAEQGRKFQQLGLSYKYSLGILGMFVGDHWLLTPTPGASMNRKCLILKFSGWFGDGVREHLSRKSAVLRPGRDLLF